MSLGGGKSKASKPKQKILLSQQTSILALCQYPLSEDLPLEDNGKAHRLSVGINCSFLCHSKSQVDMVVRTGGPTKEPAPTPWLEATNRSSIRSVENVPSLYDSFAISRVRPSWQLHQAPKGCHLERCHTKEEIQ